MTPLIATTWQAVNHLAFDAGFGIAEAAGVIVFSLLVGVALIRRLLRAAGW